MSLLLVAASEMPETTGGAYFASLRIGTTPARQDLGLHHLDQAQLR